MYAYMYASKCISPSHPTPLTTIKHASAVKMLNVTQKETHPFISYINLRFLLSSSIVAPEAIIDAKTTSFNR